MASTTMQPKQEAIDLLNECWSKDFGADVLAYLHRLAERVVFIAGVEEASGASAVDATG